MRKPCRHQPGGAWWRPGRREDPNQAGQEHNENSEGWIIQAEDCQEESNSQQLVASWELGKQTNSTASGSRHLTQDQ